MKKISSILFVLSLLTLVLASCKAPAPESDDEADPYVLFTAAAQTAEVSGSELNMTPLSPTATLANQATPAGGGDPTATPIRATSDAPPSQGDKAEFVDDITIPDETALPPNAPFTKTWLLRNAGSTTWTTDYMLVFVGGDQMNAPEASPLPRAVGPKETIELSVELVAPQSEAHYTGYFNLRNPSGDDFGVGDTGIEAFWVDIYVDESAAPPATATPAVSPDVVTQNFLYVDAATAETCPHTYKFTYIITLSEPAPVTYQLVADTVPRLPIKLPDPVTTQLNAGTHTYQYELEFTSSISGWIAMHVIFPGDQLSNTVNIKLTCQ